jgi:hypothetical protein
LLPAISKKTFSRDVPINPLDVSSNFIFEDYERKDKSTSYDTSISKVNGEAKPKISFPFLFPLRGGGVGGGDARKMQGNFLVFAHASPRRVRGALIRITTSVERTEKYKATTRSARAKINRFAIGNRFGLGTIDTPE